MQVNVFKGITKHTLFYVLISIIIIIQITVIIFGGFVLGIYPEYGLTLRQWGLSVLCILFRLLLVQAH